MSVGDIPAEPISMEETAAPSIPGFLRPIAPMLWLCFPREWVTNPLERGPGPADANDSEKMTWG